MTSVELSDSLADVLAGVQRMIRRRLRAGTAAPRLRGAQIDLLRLVGTRPGIRVSDAAKELYLAGNSVSTLANQLSRAGYLRRETDPADHRSVLLLPTVAATARLADWQARRSALVREQVDRLTREERAALAAALPALRRLARNLREEAEDV
ncbi:MarR family winged helix-turn-helix transcriptional regulator [Streptomyces sp. NP-1717]|uniref:MarR family winged helix-turn-helix transcriptional regulator n=1 Tax=Streptomyces sp. NP-1717 TaxID=2704470 RepID=UPI001F5C4C46|nr:MarR family transcriptional regulator [Streptomyces sp. NP-1717]MCI3223890.1 MarR family transcriptional regulator [Streptomyces sp. NP-1717]